MTTTTRFSPPDPAAADELYWDGQEPLKPSAKSHKLRNGLLIAVGVFVAFGTVGYAATTAWAWPVQASPTAADPSTQPAPPTELTSGQIIMPVSETSQRNAVRAATNYLSMMPFSHDGLITQLTTGDGYTYLQAAYGVAAVGL